MRTEQAQALPGRATSLEPSTVSLPNAQSGVGVDLGRRFVQALSVGSVNRPAASGLVDVERDTVLLRNLWPRMRRVRSPGARSGRRLSTTSDVCAMRTSSTSRSTRGAGTRRDPSLMNRGHARGCGGTDQAAQADSRSAADRDGLTAGVDDERGGRSPFRRPRTVASRCIQSGASIVAVPSALGSARATITCFFS